MITIAHQSASVDASRVVVVCTTWPADRDPLALVAPLVEEGLAACVNVLPPMESVYRWNGALHHDAERQLLIKTTVARLDALHHRLSALHPYDLPEFLVLEVAAVAVAYRDWVVANSQAG